MSRAAEPTTGHCSAAFGDEDEMAVNATWVVERGCSNGSWRPTMIADAMMRPNRRPTSRGKRPRKAGRREEAERDK